MSSLTGALGLLELGQTAVNANSVIADDLSPFTIAYDSSKLTGNGVAVPVVLPSGGRNVNMVTADFTTDSSNSIVTKNVIITSAGQDDYVIKNYQYDQLENIVRGGLLDKMIMNASKAVSDVIWGAVTTANFSGVVSGQGWSESTPTLSAMYKSVQAAIGSGKFNKNNITIAMPSSTFGAFQALLPYAYQDIMSNLNFKIVPVYTASFTNSFIMDSSCLAIGFGGDVAGGPTDEFNFISSANGKLGFGIHFVHEDLYARKHLSILAPYGYQITNATGAAKLA